MTLTSRAICFTGQLDAYAALDGAGHRTIDRESAAALLAEEG
jgi:hypothetical protein